MNEHTCWEYPKPPTDPRGYRCPRCRVVPGELCVSPQKGKITHSHQARADRMIRAYNRWAGSHQRACQLDGPCSR